MENSNKNVITNNKSLTDVTVSKDIPQRRVSQRTPRWKKSRRNRYGTASGSFTVRY